VGVEEVLKVRPRDRSFKIFLRVYGVFFAAGTIAAIEHDTPIALGITLAFLAIALWARDSLLGNQHFIEGDLVSLPHDPDEMPQDSVYLGGQWIDPETGLSEQRRAWTEATQVPKRWSVRAAAGAIFLFYCFSISRTKAVQDTASVIFIAVALGQTVLCATLQQFVMPIGWLTFAVLIASLKTKEIVQPSFILFFVMLVVSFLFYQQVRIQSQFNPESTLEHEKGRIQWRRVFSEAFIFCALVTAASVLIPPRREKIPLEKTPVYQIAQKLTKLAGNHSSDDAPDEGGLLKHKPGDTGEDTKDPLGGVSPELEADSKGQPRPPDYSSTPQATPKPTPAPTPAPTPVPTPVSPVRIALAQAKLGLKQPPPSAIPTAAPTDVSSSSPASNQTAPTAAPKPQKPKNEVPKKDPAKELLKFLLTALIALLALFLIVFYQKLKKRTDPKKIRIRNIPKPIRKELEEAIAALRAQKLSPRDEVIHFYHLFLRIMSAAKYARELYLPTTDYGRDLIEAFPALDEHFIHVTDTFEDTLYGDIEVEPPVLGVFRKGFDQIVRTFVS